MYCALNNQAFKQKSKVSHKHKYLQNEKNTNQFTKILFHKFRKQTIFYSFKHPSTLCYETISNKFDRSQNASSSSQIHVSTAVNVNNLVDCYLFILLTFKGQ